MRISVCLSVFLATTAVSTTVNSDDIRDTLVVTASRIPVPLSTTGTLWSYTDNHYQPPAPYMSPDPFQPYAIAAVELADEKMVVLGQVASGTATGDLQVGMRMKLVAETLYADDAKEFVVWKWAPAARVER